MNFSLLRIEEDSPASCQIIYDVSVDRAIGRIESDKRKADYFLKIVSQPLTNINNIVFRQELMKDFIINPGLIDELKLVFSRYDKIKSDWEQMKVNVSSSVGISPEVVLEHTFSSLKSTAVFPTTLQSFYGIIGETLSKYDVKSKALVSIYDYCRNILDSQYLSKIIEVSQKFRHGEVEDFTYTLAVKTDDSLYPIYNEIISVEDKNKKKGFFFKKEKNEEAKAIISEDSDTGNDPSTNTIEMLASALSHIDMLLTKITGELYDMFYGLSVELTFYEVALKYVESAKNQQVNYVFPTVLPDKDDCINLKGLKELLLLTEEKGRITVPNDFNLSTDKHGLIVKGMTDSGKTVYLRAIAACQLFAQCGLPVLAEFAEVSVRHGFFSHFSSAEEEFLKGNAQGRFDQEAGEISKIIDCFKPYSLLLLNETFQTTSYDEGTESIYNILRYMPKLKTKYIFVTHLTQLFNYMSKENVILAKTSDNSESKYKINVIN